MNDSFKAGVEELLQGLQHQSLDSSIKQKWKHNSMDRRIIAGIDAKKQV